MASTMVWFALALAMLTAGTLDEAVRDAEEAVQRAPDWREPFAYSITIAQEGTGSPPSVTVVPDVGCTRTFLDLGSTSYAEVSCVPPPSPGTEWQCSLPSVAVGAPFDLVPGSDVLGGASCIDSAMGNDRGARLDVDGPGEGASHHQGAGHRFPFRCHAGFAHNGVEHALGTVHCSLAGA